MGAGLLRQGAADERFTARHISCGGSTAFSLIRFTPAFRCWRPVTSSPATSARGSGSSRRALCSAARPSCSATSVTICGGGSARRGCDAFLRLPAATGAACTPADRASAYLLGLGPWLLLHQAAVLLGPAPDAVIGRMVWESGLPALEWSAVVYALTLPFVLAAPLCCRRPGDLRTFVQMAWLATAAGLLCFLLIPLAVPPRPVPADGVWSRLLVAAQAACGPAGAFPSFHVFWPLLAAWLYGRSFGLKPLWYLVAAAMAFSSLAVARTASQPYVCR